MPLCAPSPIIMYYYHCQRLHFLIIIITLSFSLPLTSHVSFCSRFLADLFTSRSSYLAKLTSWKGNLIATWGNLLFPFFVSLALSSFSLDRGALSTSSKRGYVVTVWKYELRCIWETCPGCSCRARYRSHSTANRWNFSTFLSSICRLFSC